MDMREEKVVVETDRYRVTGSMTLPANGFRSRLSDHLNREDLTFFTIVGAELTPLDGGASHTTSVLMLARQHIRLVIPAETA